MLWNGGELVKMSLQLKYNNMKTREKTSVRVHYKGAKGLDSFATTINLNKGDAINYYLDKKLNVGDGEHDYIVKCYKVEVLNKQN